LRTKAEPQPDGSYKVSGSKIFISGGEHDMSENIVHLVLARLPDAPAGMKGISLLLVPKFIAKADGTPGERNALSCGAIEHKMGIKGAATCVMNFDGATGWVVGEPNQGLACMFTMMNDARFQVGLQGLGIAEQAYQGSLGYARERLQSRGLAGVQHPDKVADPIIVHPDVRRMLLTQKTLVEGSRMLAAYCARQLDLEHGHPEPSYRKAASKRAALLIPIVKAFFTDMGQEVASLGVQVYGGHGYIREWGMEQLMRDSRITQLYEGTNGIQALDYIRRKLLGDGGTELSALQAEFSEICDQQVDRPALQAMASKVQARIGEWRELSAEIIAATGRDPQEIGAVSVDFLQYSAYVLLAGLWLQAAARAQDALEQGVGEEAFYQAKLASADFYLRRVLPRASAHREAIQGGADCVMALPESDFAF
jgi:alkylation response protein AidB-like acyl-CoA dehydrogenase